MATVNNNPNATAYSGNAQLNGIVSSVPMPNAPIPTVVNGTPVNYSPTAGTISMGGSTGAAFTVGAPGSSPEALTNYTQANADTNNTVSAGGDTAPVMGAQPSAPNAVSNATSGAAAVGAPVMGETARASETNAAVSTPAATSSPAFEQADFSGRSESHRVKAPSPGVAATAGTGTPTAEAVSVSGFGRNDRSSVMKAKIGEATFSFPAFNTSKKSVEAPSITWGEGWKRIDKGDGFYYMQHSNGAKAIPAVEWRVTPNPLDAAKTIKTANGWGKKFPDGSMLIFDKQDGPYKLDKNGKKTKLKSGVHSFGKVKVRIFEASVVRVLEPNGAVSVFDSRGNHGAGTPRKTLAAAIAGGGAKQLVAGAAPMKDTIPMKGAPMKGDTAATTAQVQAMTAKARELLQEVRQGSIDPAKLQEFQTQLSHLPDGIRQAIGASGITTGDAAALGIPVTNATANGGGGSSTEVTAPTAGHDANPTSKMLSAGSSIKIDEVPTELHGANGLRFGQLPDDLQEKIAVAFGSTQSGGAFKADTRIAFGKDGSSVQVMDDTTLYMRKKIQVAGAGPGEDLALTLKPVRQPGAAKRTHGGGATAKVKGGGGLAAGLTEAKTKPVPAVATTKVVGGGANAGPSSITLFSDGKTIAVPSILESSAGSYTWSSLPADARSAIIAYLTANSETEAGKTWAGRGEGEWELDPNATLTIGNGLVTFTSDMKANRAVNQTQSQPQVATPAASAPASSSAPVAPGSASSSSSTPPSAGSTNASAAPAPTPPAPAANASAASPVPSEHHH